MQLPSRPNRIIAVCLTFLGLSLSIVPAGSQTGSFVPTPVVDEPIGARYSLGMTLWHLGHSPEAIREFHAFLREKKMDPATMSPSNLAPAPVDLRRILIEPERLPPAASGGWKAEGAYLTSGAGDQGPTVAIPLHIDRRGLYRLWVRYYAWTTGAAVTSLKIYRKGKEDDGPLVNDEIFDWPAEKEGPAWKSILVDLDAGDYSLRLGHVTRWWHTQGIQAQYLPRKIDCLYLTDEIWEEAPADAILNSVRQSGAPADTLDPVFRTQPRVTPEATALWRLWQVRPVAWEDSATSPRLFQLSREFWRRKIDEIAKRPYDLEKPPDYRTPERQVIFDDTWNMVGNPARITRQIAALQGDIDRSPRGHEWYWLQPGEFEKISGQWIRQGGTLHAEWGAREGAAEQDLKVQRAATYQVWVRFRQINYQETWKIEATTADGQAISFTRDQMKYDPDIVAQSAWQRVGALDMKQPGDIHFKISLLPNLGPATYRYVYDVFVTTDPDYKPQGTIRPALSKQQYLAKALALGAREEDGFITRAALGIDTVSQEWWPDGPQTSESPRLPGTSTSQGQNKTLVLPGLSVIMGQDMVQPVQIRMRNLRETPIILIAGSLQALTIGSEEKRFPFSWRVTAFAPLGNTRQQWSPCILMRRPSVTIPPLSVAQLWVNLDSHGVAPGKYNFQMMLDGTIHQPGLARQTFPIQVRVTPVKVAPRNPVFVSGYTAPPEGASYREAFAAHGLNVGHSEISKADMQKQKLRLLLLPQWDANEEATRQRVDRLKELGLDYSDWAFTIRDEPSGTTKEQLKEYIDVAETIRRADPKARISFNPGEAAKLQTFELLDPYCDFWLPYSLHTNYVVDLQKKIDIYSKKPWMWYTTPCYGDKSPGIANGLYSQIRQIPAMPGNCVGTAFFAFYYPFRDPWDTAYEHIGDVSVMMLPSRQGAVLMPATEGIRAGAQAANLAVMVKERAAATDQAAQKLIKEGSAAELIAWLEKHP